ncbi:MAG: hypothetical protein WHX60_07175 [Armatimonadota bacterium]
MTTLLEGEADIRTVLPLPGERLVVRASIGSSEGSPSRDTGQMAR